MTDRRRHRGSHPSDHRLFADSCLHDLRAAVDDLSFLSTRGYAKKSSAKLVGDRYGLTARQRTAAGRCACGDTELADRSSREASPGAVAGSELLIDGFNVLTTIESALSGGLVLAARDGCFRDMAGMHGTYRVLEESRPAVRAVMTELEALAPARARWFLDQPVSNSGRLKTMISEIGKEFSVETAVSVVPDPDPVLAKSARLIEGRHVLVATADSGILDGCGPWFNLARHVVEHAAPEAWVVSL